MDYKFIITIVILCVIAVAAFMESYKKIIRKDTAKHWEIHTVAVGISLIVAVCCYFGFSLPGSLWAIPLYFFGFYTAQFFVNMKVVKAIVKWFIKKKGVTLEGYNYDE
ncbi:MAG: hypothetical protein GX585_05700 [Clostridiales bacterium]|nr:hypothetical protein [Clostridiales bacterium]